MSQNLEQKLVSIIMPAYNVEKYIAASITSVLNQTYSNLELIVIDDGSTDGTAAIINSFTIKDERIIYVYQENAKQAIARNKGISVAKGEILAFLDSDDLWLPNKLEQSIKSFELDQYDLLLTNYYVTSAKEIDVFNPNYEVMKVDDCLFSGEEALKAFIKLNRVPILTVLVKKEIVEKVGCFDECCVPAEDYDLWIRLLKNRAVFKSISVPLSIYRLHESSSTSSDRLATYAVLKSLAKNFSQEEIILLKSESYLKWWILRWIDFCLNKHNVLTLKKYVYYFNLGNISIAVLFILRNFFGFIIFKRLIKKLIKS
jgi:teichuronic acid biosynthesis glycosyltransferase TuaG